EFIVRHSFFTYVGADLCVRPVGDSERSGGHTGPPLQPPIYDRLPGFIATSPRAQASQLSGSTDGTSSCASEILGTPTSASPDDRSIIEAAPMTFAPAARKASIVSLVEPPVVTTSSTTRVFSPG